MKPSDGAVQQARATQIAAQHPELPGVSVLQVGSKPPDARLLAAECLACSRAVSSASWGRAELSLFACRICRTGARCSRRR